MYTFLIYYVRPSLFFFHPALFLASLHSSSSCAVYPQSLRCAFTGTFGWFRDLKVLPVYSFTSDISVQACQMFGMFPYYSPCCLSYDLWKTFWWKNLVIFDIHLRALQRNPVSWSCWMLFTKTQALLGYVSQNTIIQEWGYATLGLKLPSASVNSSQCFKMLS